MITNIKNCVGKRIAYKMTDSDAYLNEGVVTDYIDSNTVRIDGQLVDPNKIIIHAVLSDSINESGNGGEQLIEG